MFVMQEDVQAGKGQKNEMTPDLLSHPLFTYLIIAVGEIHNKMQMILQGHVLYI